MPEITEDSLLILGERKRGRPRVPEPMTSVSVRLPVTIHDQLAKLSLTERKSVSELVRTIVAFRLR